MSDVATTRLSSRGQVVIPEELRNAMGLEPGARFVVFSEGDVLLFKRIDAPDRRAVRALAAAARRRAKRAGARPADVRRAVRDARRRG